MLRSLVKPLVPSRLQPAAIEVYVRAYRRYFSLYRQLRRPNRSYVAVAEQNYRTLFPPEWTSVCIEHADITVDLEGDYDFGSLGLDDIRFAYSGHTIEHLSDRAVRRLLANLYKSMRLGAVIRIECPDLDLLLNDYKCLGDDRRLVTRQMVALMEASLQPEKGGTYDQEHLKVLMGIVNYYDHQQGKVLPPVVAAEEFHRRLATLSNGEFGDWAVSLLTAEQLHNSYMHRNWFNFEKLCGFLQAAGFSDAVRCACGETRYNFKMNINRKHRAWCSIFVEALKR